MTNLRSVKDSTVMEDGFSMQVTSEVKALLVGQGLLNRGVLHLANGLAGCEASNAAYPTKALPYENCIYSLFHSYGSTLYSYLLNMHGAEAINSKLWVHLARYLGWPLRAQVFKDIPTAILEESGREIWQAYRYAALGYNNGREEAIRQLGRRDDIYGSATLSPELLLGITFLMRSDPPFLA